MGATAIREWGVGQKGKSNGVIFFVFTDDRALRLEVGYGLEGVLPDARARQITSDVMKPFLKKGDHAGGIEAGAEAVIAAVRGEGFQGTGRTVAEGGRETGTRGYLPALAGLVAVGLTALCGLVLGKNPRQNPRFYVFFPLFAFSVALFAGGIIAQEILWAGGGILLLVVALLILGFRQAARVETASSPSDVSSASSSASWASSSSASSSSSDFSGSDFSGGGGDGGGGGSSNSW